jgi:hypothetical protein
LKEHDPITRRNVSNWFLPSVHDGKVDSQLVLFSNEVSFSLHAEVNYQNNRDWSAENPELIHELPVHDEEWVFGVK